MPDWSFGCNGHARSRCDGDVLAGQTASEMLANVNGPYSMRDLAEIVHAETSIQRIVCAG